MGTLIEGRFPQRREPADTGSEPDMETLIAETIAEAVSGSALLSPNYDYLRILDEKITQNDLQFITGGGKYLERVGHCAARIIDYVFGQRKLESTAPEIQEECRELRFIEYSVLASEVTSTSRKDWSANPPHFAALVLEVHRRAERVSAYLSTQYRG